MILARNKHSSLLLMAKNKISIASNICKCLYLGTLSKPPTPTKIFITPTSCVNVVKLYSALLTVEVSKLVCFSLASCLGKVSTKECTTLWWKLQDLPACKYKARLKKLGMGKHSSLFPLSISNEEINSMTCFRHFPPLDASCWIWTFDLRKKS
jgi:hypothetical protein